MQKVLRAIDLINSLAGKGVVWLLIPMTGITAYEVVARYIAHAPTRWAWDINVQLMAAMAFLLGGYCLYFGAHVGVDVFTSRLSPRKKAWLELTLMLVFFFTFGVMLMQYWGSTWDSVRMKETTSSAFAPPIYPLKVLAVIGIILFLLQAVAIFVRTLGKLVRTKEEGARER